MNTRRLTALEPNQQIIVGGDRVVTVPEELRQRFRPGDSLVYADAADELLLIPETVKRTVDVAVHAALEAFERMRSVTERQIDDFYERFAARLDSDGVWSQIAAANAADVDAARRRGRSTTRLVASDTLRRNMIAGLRGWKAAPSARGRVIESVQHEGWAVDLILSELGVVAFVFEGRPNVLADATGVLKGGNTVVLRIGRDALGTARTIMDVALVPALMEAGLPEGAVQLLDSAEHAAGWALFMQRRVALAVARGSGRAVAVLGSLARQAGVPVSLHGTGGAWLVVSPAAAEAELSRVVAASLDRKVCNTLNVCCIPRREASRFVPALIEGLEVAGQRRGQAFKLHVVEGDETAETRELAAKRVGVTRAEGVVTEAQAEPLSETELGREWEWEETPEITLKLVDDIEDAITLFNLHSPRFVASLLSPDSNEQQGFFERVDAPFVGDDYTRWVDGQLALRRPELGLSNWEHGRLLARAGVLTGDGIYTVRTRARRTAALSAQSDVRTQSKSPTNK